MATSFLPEYNGASLAWPWIAPTHSGRGMTEKGTLASLVPSQALLASDPTAKASPGKTEAWLGL